MLRLRPTRVELTPADKDEVRARAADAGARAPSKRHTSTIPHSLLSSKPSAATAK